MASQKGLVNLHMFVRQRFLVGGGNLPVFNFYEAVIQDTGCSL